MKYTAIGLLSWPLIFGLLPVIGPWAFAVCALLIPALWSVTWRIEFGTWRFWS